MWTLVCLTCAKARTHLPIKIGTIIPGKLEGFGIFSVKRWVGNWNLEFGIIKLISMFTELYAW
jgi:hypothetical protein